MGNSQIEKAAAEANTGHQSFLAIVYVACMLRNQQAKV
jgi:hypothetical protein